MTAILDTATFISSLIVSISVLITAILIIVQSITKYNPLIPIRTWFNKPVKTQIEEMNVKNDLEHKKILEITHSHTEKLKEIGIARLKNDICNSELPLVERVNSVDRYLAKGLNGEIKVIGNILKEQLESDLKESGKVGRKKVKWYL